MQPDTKNDEEYARKIFSESAGFNNNPKNNFDILIELFSELDANIIIDTIDSTNDNLEQSIEYLLTKTQVTDSNDGPPIQVVIPKKKSAIHLNRTTYQPPESQLQSQVQPQPRPSSIFISKPRKGFSSIAKDMKLEKLQSTYSWLDYDIVKQFFDANNGNYNAAVQQLSDVYDVRYQDYPKKKSPIEKVVPQPATKPAVTINPDSVGSVIVNHKELLGETSRNREEQGKLYDKYRQEAIQHATLRNLAFREATQAYLSGNGAAAKKLSEQGRYHDEKMKDLHAKAGKQIFLNRNRQFGNLLTIDLHGLHVKEAIEVLDQLFLGNNQLIERGDKKKIVSIITGAGKHSLHGRARLKPTVKNFLRDHKITHTETQAGVFVVQIS